MESKKEINAIIIDDEKGCIENLRYYLQKLCPAITVLDSGNNLADIIEKVGAKNIDLAFLDVELFDSNIFSALSSIEEPDFKIVFVTAHEQYALKAIKTEALDYMLKPLAEEDILECYTKIKKHFLQEQEQEEPNILHDDKKRTKIILKSSDRIYVIRAEDIYYITGRGFYSDITFIFNNDIKTVIVSKPLNKTEIEYEHPSFFRIHKSYIINTKWISDIIKNNSGTSVKMTDAHTIPVAKRREHEFLSFLNEAS